MSAHAQPRLTPEEYLEIERAADFKSEYYNGHMYAMSGGSYPHVRIIVNLTGDLHTALKKGSCQVISNDLRLRVSPGGLYTYPDVSVVCGELKFADGRKDTFANPALIIEVLSPSTEAYDRGFKSHSIPHHRIPRGNTRSSRQNEPRVENFSPPARPADGCSPNPPVLKARADSKAWAARSRWRTFMSE